MAEVACHPTCIPSLGWLQTTLLANLYCLCCTVGWNLAWSLNYNCLKSQPLVHKLGGNLAFAPDICQEILELLVGHGNQDQKLQVVDEEAVHLAVQASGQGVQEYYRRFICKEMPFIRGQNSIMSSTGGWLSCQEKILPNHRFLCRFRLCWNFCCWLWVNCPPLLLMRPMLTL